MTINSFRNTSAILACTVILNTGTAAAQGTTAYQIPPGPLDAALSAFSSTSGVRLIYDSALTDGRSSSGISGDLSADAALGLLLAGTGLAHDIDGRSAAIFETSQPQGGGSAILLDQILVQGELQTRTLQDTQTSVAVITGDELEQRADPDIFTVIERTPGVTTAAGNQAFAIRGVPAFGFAAGRGNGQAVATVVDGASLSNVSAVSSEIRLSVWDLEQIEILRGPQSTQTGRNALFGVVSLQSQEPTYKTEFKLRGEVGRFDTVGGAFAANVPLIDDTLALRVSADLRNTDGFIDNLTLGTNDTGGAENVTARAALRFDPSEDFTATLSFFHITDSVGQNEVLDDPFPRDRVTLVDQPFLKDSRINSVSLDMEYFLSDTLSIVSKSNYFEGDSESLQDGDGTADPISVFDREREGSNIQQELQLRYDDSRTQAVIGGFFADIEESSVTNTFAAAPNRLTNQTDTRNYAVFGEVETRVLNDLRLIAGFRYDRESVDTSALSNVTGTPTAFAASDSFSAFLPKAGIVYDITEDFSLGFTAQRGYRAGGVVSNFSGNPNSFDPEKTWNFEGSLRSSWLDGRVTANANVFYTRWRDQQVLQTVPAGPPFFVDVEVTNAGRSRLFGGELSVSAVPTDRLELFASGAFVDTEFVDFVAFGQDFSGNEFNFAPRFTAAAGATYTFENGFFASGDASYTGESFSDTANTLKNDARFLVNARVGYRAENWEIFLYARNLLDEDYALERRPSGTTIVAEPGEPLTVGLVGQIRF